MFDNVDTNNLTTSIEECKNGIVTNNSKNFLSWMKGSNSWNTKAKLLLQNELTSLQAMYTELQILLDTYSKIVKMIGVYKKLQQTIEELKNKIAYLECNLYINEEYSTVDAEGTEVTKTKTVIDESVAAKIKTYEKMIETTKLEMQELEISINNLATV